MEQTSEIEPRLFVETGLEAKVAEIIEPVIESMGYQLVRIRTNGENGLTLQIMAERPDGTMSVQDCEAVSRAIAPVLEVEDPIERAYHLEMSSPGIDRPMVRRADFIRWAGHILKCETSVLVEGRKRFRGWIGEVDETGFVIERDDPGPNEEAILTIPFAAYAEGKLILTDELVDQALKADKLAKKAQKKADYEKSLIEDASPEEKPTEDGSPKDSTSE